MPELGQATAKQYYHDWYKHRNKQSCYNYLNLENSIKITKIRIMEWKIDEGWSCDWCVYYITVGYQINTDEKAKVIVIRNESTLMVLLLQ